MSLSKRIPVCPTEIKAGIPFPWAVYDVGGMLLLNAGMAPSTPAQAQALIARGLYRERTGALDAVPEKPSTAPPAPELARGAPAPVKGDPLPFDTLALRPGELLQVHSALEVASDFLPVALIGYLKDQTLITTHPRVGGRPMHLAEGALLNIKAFSGTNLFNFKTKVLRAYPEPTPHLHLAYPKCVYVTRVRTALRAVVDLPADLRDRVTGATTPVVLKDLSVGGGATFAAVPNGNPGGPLRACLQGESSR